MTTGAPTAHLRIALAARRYCRSDKLGLSFGSRQIYYSRSYIIINVDLHASQGTCFLAIKKIRISTYSLSHYIYPVNFDFNCLTKVSQLSLQLQRTPRPKTEIPATYQSIYQVQAKPPLKAAPLRVLVVD